MELPTKSPTGAQLLPSRASAVLDAVPPAFAALGVLRGDRRQPGSASDPLSRRFRSACDAARADHAGEARSRRTSPRRSDCAPHADARRADVGAATETGVRDRRRRVVQITARVGRSSARRRKRPLRADLGHDFELRAAFRDETYERALECGPAFADHRVLLVGRLVDTLEPAARTGDLLRQRDAAIPFASVPLASMP